MSNELAKLMDMLLAYSPPPGVFNPWRDFDFQNDIGPEAPTIRLEQLTQYMQQRIGKAKLALIAEAPSYQGCKFTGIAMTSEQLMNGRYHAIDPELILHGMTPRRTSRHPGKPYGWAEHTGTMVWTTLVEAGLHTDEVVLWNAFPFHTHVAGNRLSNRTPDAGELQEGRRYVDILCRIYPGVQLVAVGRRSEHVLKSLGMTHTYVRHPSHAGKPEFVEGLLRLLTVAHA